MALCYGMPSKAITLISHSLASIQPYIFCCASTSGHALYFHFAHTWSCQSRNSIFLIICEWLILVIAIELELCQWIPWGFGIYSFWNGLGTSYGLELSCCLVWLSAYFLPSLCLFFLFSILGLKRKTMKQTTLTYSKQKETPTEFCPLVESFVEWVYV